MSMQRLRELMRLDKCVSPSSTAISYVIHAYMWTHRRLIRTVSHATVEFCSSAVSVLALRAHKVHARLLQSQCLLNL